MAHPDSRQRVLVIYGRNDAARRGLFDFLRSIGLMPIEWSQAIAMTGRGSPYIGDVLAAAFSDARSIVVLMTPDDASRLDPQLARDADPEMVARFQPRPNVLFEAGMAVALAPKRTIFVQLGEVKVPSDIYGRHVVRLDNSIGRRTDLADRLAAAGCEVDLSGRDWHEAGDLTPPDPGEATVPGVGRVSAHHEKPKSYRWSRSWRRPRLRAHWRQRGWCQ